MKLLVSVSDDEEAYEAVKGGCDILDVKNPREGSLGASHPSIIRRIVNRFKGEVEVSATIGDLPNLPGTASLAALGAASLGVDYVKVGLYGVRKPEDALTLLNWIVKSVKETYSSVKVIACGYADYRDIDSLNPTYLPSVAWRSGADGILIDVKRKDSGKVFDHLDLEELTRIFLGAKRMGLITALAGGLEIKDIDAVVKTGVDVMGVRRCVCDTKSWISGRVRAEKVMDLKRMLRELLYRPVLPPHP